MCGVRRVIDVLNLRQYVVNINIILYKDKTVNIFFFYAKNSFITSKVLIFTWVLIYIYIEKNQRRQILIINCFTPFVLCLLYIFIFFNFDFILWWCRCYISMLCMQCCDDSNTYLHRHRLWFILSFTNYLESNH